MSERGFIYANEFKFLSRIALYIVILAWVCLGLYILTINDAFVESIPQHFLSTEQEGVKFRALILLAPFVLTVLSYLVNEKAKLLRKSLIAEDELRLRTIDLEKANEHLSHENEERKKVEEQLTYQAFYDSLTNLPNRALFIDHLQTALERRKRYKDYAFTVLFLDVDRFKVINDSLGHLMGDQLLIMLAQRLKKHVRALDTIARFGGDEFAFLMDSTKEASDAKDVAARIHEEMQAPFSLFGRELVVSVSIGIVLSDMGEYKTPDELLRDADTAMYNAKARGRACHAIFDSTMHAEATLAFVLETDLRKAVERKEFSLFYQPILSVQTNSITGFEALLRWHHPERGLVTPSEFIAVAEETGLILSLNPWIIREACSQLRAWQTQYPEYQDVTVSINVSSKVFSQPAFYDFIETTLRETGLDGRYLRLEIIERTLIENPEPAAALMTRLMEIGVRFDIDDFGTGYSALNYLRHFPIKGLKIDGSYISALTSDKNNAEIVKTMVALGRTLNLDVIAEGVETIDQLNSFKTMKGELAQGFYLSLPMNSKAAGELLASHKPSSQ